LGDVVKPPLSLVSPDDQRVTWVELFFDLVFVFCVTQTVTLVHGHLDLASAASALLVFWLVWWAWTQFTWALNAANTDHPRVQLAMLTATAVAFFLAVGIPRALGDGALWFAVTYVAVRVIGLAVYFWVASSDPLQWRAVRVFALLSAAGLIAVLAGAVVGGSGQYICWTLAITLDLLAAGVAGQLEGWNLHPDHFAERHGLIVIIALGETLIVAASGLVTTRWTPAAIVTGILAVAVTCALWWSYFRQARMAFENALAARQGNARSRLARDVFSVMHFPMLCGVIAMAAATEQALTRPDLPLDPGARLALGGGATLFVGGTAMALWRATGRAQPWRIALVSAAAVAVYVLAATPAVAMAIVLALLVTLAVIEHRQPVIRLAHCVPDS
jgi:low temperature requirement protein LtrA